MLPPIIKFVLIILPLVLACDTQFPVTRQQQYPLINFQTKMINDVMSAWILAGYLSV